MPARLVDQTGAYPVIDDDSRVYVPPRVRDEPFVSPVPAAQVASASLEGLVVQPEFAAPAEPAIATEPDAPAQPAQPRTPLAPELSMGMMGERPGITYSSYDPRAVYAQVASVPRGEFKFGSPDARNEFRVFSPTLYTCARLDMFQSLDFVDETSGYVDRKDATQIPRQAVRKLLESPRQSGRMLIYRDEHEGATVNPVVDAVRKMFNAEGDSTVVRDDGKQQHGTSAWLGRSGNLAVVIVLRSELYRNKQGRYLVTPVIEMTKVSSSRDIKQIASELSYWEEVWLDIQLGRWQATSAERAEVGQRADRHTVQCYDDAWQLLLQIRHPRLRARHRAVNALRGIIRSGRAFLWPQIEGADQEIDDHN